MSELQPDLTMGAEDFSAGFLDTPQPDTLPYGATPDAKNAVFINVETQDQTRVTMRRRKGCLLTNPTAISSGKRIDGAWEFTREGGAGELIVLCNGALYKWDGVSAYTALTNGGGFSVGATARAFKYKNNLHVSDGVQQKRYDGTACYAIGYIAPTAAPALAVAAGPGVTGTYEGYAVWVDATTGHESSPSAISTAVAFVNQQRQWTKPAGAPPANVTHWRIYSRRTDTNEANYFRTGVDQLVATATYTELTSDTARNVAGAGPGDSSNDVPPVFAMMEEFNGYRLAVKPNSSDLYISKQGDAESQHPKDIFPVGGRGDTKPVRSIRKFGEEVYLRKPTMAYRLSGDRVPFQIKSVDSSMGAVSPTSGQEIDGLWYDWDEQRGPYQTDMNSVWEPLADNRISTIVGTVNKLYLDYIESAHYATLNLVMWAVPTTSSRKATILAYNYRLKRWLPPITGFEFSVLTMFTTTTGARGLYFGDEWGRVYELFNGEVDGVPSGTLTAAITGATAGTITAGAAAFYATGSGLAGMPVFVKSPAGRWQIVRAQSNTGQVITLDTINGPPLAPVPLGDGTWTVVVGAIEWYWNTPRNTGRNRRIEKRGRVLYVEGSSTSADHQLEVSVRYNKSVAYQTAFVVTFPVAGLAWGIGTWGTDAWGAGGDGAMRKKKWKRSFFDAQMRFQNYYPNQPFELASYAMTADWQPRRSVVSAP
jgi:hypothetical protein